VDAGRGVRGDPHEDVAEIEEGIQPRAAAALDQGVDRARGVAAAFAPGKQPVLAPDGDGADGDLAGVMPCPGLCRVGAGPRAHASVAGAMEVFTDAA